MINVKVSDLNERLEYLKLTFVSKIPFITDISDLIGNEISKTEKSSIELEGISNIFNFPEYRDLNKAKELIHFLEDKSELENLFLSYSGDEIYVSIGRENNKDFLNENTIVATSYDLGDGSKGKIAVIGPTRMDYEKIISTMLSLNDRFRDILK